MGRPFWSLVAIEMLNTLGDAFGTIALGWLVYDLTGSKLAMGTLLFLGMIAEAVGRLVGGPLSDRLDRSRLLGTLDLIRFVAYLIAPLLAMGGYLQLWHLYALSVVAGLAQSLYDPTLVAMIPQIVGEEQLARANGFISGTLSVIHMIGPGIAGLAIALWGSSYALAFDAVTFGITGLVLVAFARHLGGRPTVTAVREGYLHQAAAGFRFFFKEPALLVLALLIAVQNIGFWVSQSMMIPFVREVLRSSAETMGLIGSGFPAGFIVGSFAATTLGKVRRRRLLILTCLCGWGLFDTLLALAGPGQVALVVGALACVGFVNGLAVANITAVYQELVPRHLLGRVMVVRFLIAWSINPVGAILGAVLTERFGFSTTFFWAGVVPALAALSGFVMPLLKRLDGGEVGTQAA